MQFDDLVNLVSLLDINYTRNVSNLNEVTQLGFHKERNDR